MQEWNEFVNSLKENGYSFMGWQTELEGNSHHWENSCITVYVDEIEKTYTIVDSGD